MNWRDVIDLVTVLEVDRGGGVFELEEVPRSVFANRKSVNRDEFYKAQANNLIPSIAFEIRSVDYADEQKAVHEGMEYIVLRTYSRNGETTELVCQSVDDVQTNLAQLRDSVDIWHHTFVENSMGELSPQAVRLFTVPAQISQLGGGTVNVEDAVETSETLSVTIKYRPGIRTDMFLMIAGRRYDIDQINDPLNRHSTLILKARRVVN